jgi:hypothetical protein
MVGAMFVCTAIIVGNRVVTTTGVCSGGARFDGPKIMVLSSTSHPDAVGRSGIKLSGMHEIVQHGSSHGSSNSSLGGNVGSGNAGSEGSIGSRVGAVRLA